MEQKDVLFSNELDNLMTDEKVIDAEFLAIQANIDYTTSEQFVAKQKKYKTINLSFFDITIILRDDAVADDICEYLLCLSFNEISDKQYSEIEEKLIV